MRFSAVLLGLVSPSSSSLREEEIRNVAEAVKEASLQCAYASEITAL